MFLTVAADLVFAGIADPVRFVRTLKLRVFRKNERFWISSRQPSMESFRMKLREVVLLTNVFLSVPVFSSFLFLSEGSYISDYLLN